MFYYIYILYSETAGKYYVGHSPDPHKRLSEHNSYDNKSKFTAKYQPWELKAFFKISENRGDAMKVEKFIKKQKSKEFIKKVIAEYSNPEFIDFLIHNSIV